VSWNEQRSTDRLRAEAQRITTTGITVTQLTREMDLHNLSTTDARLVSGVHLYADITNLDELLKDETLRRENHKRLYRLLHLTRRELRHITESVFGGDKIQIQGAKFHGLLFRPYNDPEAMAADAIRVGMAMYSVLTDAVSTIFPKYPSLVPAIGIDYGECLVANIGVRGDRELISVGNAANNAAKILVGGNDSITIGKAVYDALDEDDQSLFAVAGSNYRFNCATSEEDLEAIVKEVDVTWTIQSSINRMQNEKDALPLDAITIEEARELFDITSLGKTRAKIVPAASIFVDIDGYTSLVESLDGDQDQLAGAVKVLHLFRYELQRVAECDHHAIAVQHQGDRLQVLFHTPGDDDDEVMQEALDLCIAFNSSVEDVLNKHHAVLGPLHVAIGCDFGDALVGMLGVAGDRDPVVIGHATLDAEQLQLQMSGNHLGITTTVYDAQSDELITEQFTHNTSIDCYEATGLTVNSLEAAEDEKDAKAYGTAAAASYTTKGAIVVGTRAPARAVPLKITRPYCA
jgi:class 3 adenylate cyclase